MTDPSIRGTKVVPLTTRSDERGSFVETFRQAWLPDGAPPMVQSNLSFSRAGVVRGLHFHRRQADYWCVLEGAAFVALFDLRVGSPTRGERWSDTFDADRELRGLYVPPGVAHGFCALTDLRLQYMVDTYFTGDDEQGIAWNDPDLTIDWPIDQPVVSARDAEAPSLTQIEDLPVFDPVAGR
jgi:dTDP-4-dehydrorhamnose 3,5-epimerase